MRDRSAVEGVPQGTRLRGYTPVLRLTGHTRVLVLLGGPRAAGEGTEVYRSQISESSCERISPGLLSTKQVFDFLVSTMT